MDKVFMARERIADKTVLLLRFNYISSALSLLMGLICLFVLHIEEVIPHVFLGYTVLNLLNIAAFKRHGNLTWMAIITSVLSLFSTLIITQFSGGINSPFLFVLSIIVLAGYVSTRLFGQIYFYASIIIIIAIYLAGLLDTGLIYDVVGLGSMEHFSFISLLFAVYLLGGVFGRDLLKAHHNLYKSKAEIEKRITEKETLLREVHHRVKNNLQTVSSLLSLQSRNTNDTQIQNLIRSSQNRVISMAMVHEMLYMREDLSKIEYATYVRELCEYLITSVKGHSNNVRLKIDIDRILMGIDTAIPLGLIINEIVTNALKYGIVADKPGEIHIALEKQDAINYELKIGDNGQGFTKNIDFGHSSSLGLKLIHKLTRQLKGTVEKVNTGKGTSYIIRFQDIHRDFVTPT